MSPQQEGLIINMGMTSITLPVFCWLEAGHRSHPYSRQGHKQQEVGIIGGSLQVSVTHGIKLNEDN